MNNTEHGVGIIYFPGFENLIASTEQLLQVIEIEPQTFWYRYQAGVNSFVFDKERTTYLKNLNKPLLFHGVGYPIGGSFPPDPSHLPCMQAMIRELQPLWISEHLSFNTLELNGEKYNTNFLLPPLQTAESAGFIANTIRNYSKNFQLPFLFETGVNYLAPKKFELEDGVFINSIAEESGASILLDLHNLMANELNGRQKVSDLLRQISHESVKQIHLAGGFYFKDYYLDAHSGPSNRELIELFEVTVEQLPNLCAITFEMLPDYLPYISEDQLTIQLECMNRAWDRRGRKHRKQAVISPTEKENVRAPGMKEWEHSLGLMAIGHTTAVPDSQLKTVLETDKGLEVINDLIEQFRGSLVVSSLKLSCRYIILYYGLDELNRLLRDFWKNSVPKLFASDNGLDFADYLLKQPELKSNDLLQDLIRYENYSLLTLLDQQERNVQLCFNPTELIPFLADRQLPNNLTPGVFVVSLLPEENYSENIQTVFHS